MFYLILLMIPVLGVVLGAYLTRNKHKTVEAELNPGLAPILTPMMGLARQVEADMYRTSTDERNPGNDDQTSLDNLEKARRNHVNSLFWSFLNAKLLPCAEMDKALDEVRAGLKIGSKSKKSKKSKKTKKKKKIK